LIILIIIFIYSEYRIIKTLKENSRLETRISNEILENLELRSNTVGMLNDIKNLINENTKLKTNVKNIINENINLKNNMKKKMNELNNLKNNLNDLMNKNIKIENDLIVVKNKFYIMELLEIKEVFSITKLKIVEYNKFDYDNINLMYKLDKIIKNYNFNKKYLLIGKTKDGTISAMFNKKNKLKIYDLANSKILFDKFEDKLISFELYEVLY
jgi:hypothetical protein